MAFAFSLAFGLPPTLAAAQDQLAIKGGRVVPIVGEPIEDGVILVRDGTIRAVGKGLDIPIEAKVIDATGKVVLPGFVEPHSPEPLVQANEVNPNVPFVTVIDAIDPNAVFFEEARRNGVTTAHAIPGNSTMIGGKSAVVKTSGTFAEDMILRRDAGLKLSLRPSGNSSRMSHLARLRRELDETRRYMDSLDEEAKAKADDAKAAEDDDEDDDEDDADPKAAQDEDQETQSEGDDADSKPDEPSPDAQREAMVRLLRGELPAFIYCERAMDVPQALRLIDDYSLEAVLVLGRDCYKAVDLIAGRDLPVILDPDLVFWETDPRTDEDEQIVLPRIYRESGVPITFQTEGSSSFISTTLGTSFLWYQTATAAKYGMPVDEALEALTLRPARLLGVDEFVGSIEEGKDADLIILTGEPLRLGTWVDTTIIDGEVVYQRDEDTRLKELLRPTEDRADED